MTWSLQRANGDTRLLEDWGIKSITDKRVSLAQGTVTLGFGRADLLGDLPFDPNETLVILRDGATFFRGRIISENRGAFGSNENATVTLADPWWYLEKLIYMDFLKVVTVGTSNPAPADPVLGLQESDFPTALKLASHLVISDTDTRSFINSRTMTMRVLTYAIAKGAPLAIGTIDPGLRIVREEISDATCAEVILKCLRWTPDQTGWWDYSVNPPALNIRTRENRTLLTLDVADQKISTVEINPRRDLQLTGVLIQYQRKHQRTNFEFITLDYDSAPPPPADGTFFSPAANSVAALVLTMELYGSYLDGTPPVLIAQEPAPYGVANTLWNYYKDLQFEGRIYMLVAEADLSFYLDRIIRVLNGAPAWTAASINVQQASLDLVPLENADGVFYRVELSVGPAKHLGGADLINLVRKGRTKPPPGGPSGLPGNTPKLTIGNLPARPAPPDPPHVDHAPSDYATTRTRKSGSYATAVNSPCGGTFPTCPALTGTPLPPYGPEPDYPTVVVGGTSFEGSLNLTKSRGIGTPTVSGAAHNLQETTNGDAYFTEWIFDLTLIPGNVIGAELVGTKSLSAADGSTTTAEDRIPLTLGIVQTLTTKAPAVGAEWYNPSINFWSKWGSVIYPTLRFYIKS